MRYEDLTGRRFGRLVAVSRDVRVMPNGKTRGGWTCMCDCGTEKWVASTDLKTGHTRSCGCWRQQFLNYGVSKDPLYPTWDAMRGRITKPTHVDYPRYGGRGLTVEPDWVDDFAAFRTWILEHIGHKPSAAHTLDRVENSVGYLKGNLRWATPSEQQNNKRSNRMITRNGETLTLKQWCVRLGLQYQTVKSRLNVGHWPVEVALTIPTDGTHVQKLAQHTQDPCHAQS